jgi:subtilisin family serine protease
VRVLDCEGSGWVSDIVDGLDWIIAHKPTGPAVVNMSMGGEPSAPMDAAVAQTVAAGITVVVAAGNDGMNACDSSPARAPQAITVAATDSRDRRPYWSNYGSCVDLFAPGVDVRSASITSSTANEVLSGTSMATPHVVGLVARYLQTHLTATPAQATAAVLAAATTKAVHDPQGSPNRLLFAAPPTVVPGLPTSVKVTHSSKARTATISWHKPRDNGGSSITSYRVTRNGKDTKGVGPVTVTVSAKTRKHVFSHLRKGYAYTLTVRAANAIGAGAVVSKKVAKLR